MRSESTLPESGADVPNFGTRVLDDCEIVRLSLESSFSQGAVGYRYHRDVEYRDVRRRLLATLRSEPRLAKLAPDAERILPHSLARCAEIPASWWIEPAAGGRLQLIQFQAGILALLDEARKPADVDECVQPSTRNAPPADGLGKVNRAQRRANERKQRARQLRADETTIKEIARVLRCSERSVSNYLHEER